MPKGSAKDRTHVVCSDGQELDVTYEVDEDTGSERVTAKGFKRFDGEDFDGELMAPKGRPAVGYNWFAVGVDSVTGERFHFVTEPVVSLGGDDTPTDHEVPHVAPRKGESAGGPTQVEKDAAKTTPVKDGKPHGK